MCRATVLRSLVVESTALVIILLNPPSAPLLKALTQPLVRIAAAIGPHNTVKYVCSSHFNGNILCYLFLFIDAQLLATILFQLWRILCGKEK